MAGDRPRPRYGEYATPQDQAEAIAESLPPISDRLIAPGTARPTDPAPDGSRPRPAESTRISPARSEPLSPARHDAATDVRAGRPASGSRGGRRWDRILSVALLAYGLFTVVSGLFQYSDLAGLIDRVYGMQGIGDFTSVALAGSIGLAINATNLVVYAVVLVVTLRLLQADRLAFYVPLIGGAVCALVTAVLLVIVMASDPAFQAYLSSVGG